MMVVQNKICLIGLGAYDNEGIKLGILPIHSASWDRVSGSYLSLGGLQILK